MAVSIERIDDRYFPVITCDECGSRTVVALDEHWDPEHVADQIEMMLENLQHRLQECRKDPDDIGKLRAYQRTALTMFCVLMGYQDALAEDLIRFHRWELAEIENDVSLLMSDWSQRSG